MTTKTFTPTTPTPPGYYDKTPPIPVESDESPRGRAPAAPAPQWEGGRGVAEREVVRPQGPNWEASVFDAAASVPHGGEIEAGDDDEIAEEIEIELMASWGGGVQYAEHKRAVQAGLDYLSEPGLNSLLNLPLFDNRKVQLHQLPSVQRALAKVGFLLQRSAGKATASAVPVSHPEIRARIAELEEKHPLGERTRAVDAEIRGLYSRLYPSDDADASRSPMGSLWR